MATPKPQMRRRRATGKMLWGPRGEIIMIILNPWRENRSAPVALVSHIGGIMRLPDGLIQCTFVRELQIVSGVPEYEAANHLIWSSEGRWTDSHEQFKWIVQRFYEGSFRNTIPDGGGGRKPRTQ